MNDIKMYALVADGILRLLEEKMQNRKDSMETANDRIDLINARIEIQKLLRMVEVVNLNS